MSLKETIDEDIKVAMRTKLSSVVSVLRGLKAEIQKVEKEGKIELDDPGVVKVVQRQIKKLNDSVRFAEQADRKDLVRAYKAEVTTLSVYLPKQLSKEELKVEIGKLIDQKYDNIGAVMKKLRADFDGQFDGKLASDIIKGML